MASFACWSARNLLDLYEEGRLTGGAERRVRAHLSACPGCRELAGESEGIKALLKGAAPPAAPAGLAASILRRLEEGGPPPPIPARRPLLRPDPVQAAALAGLLALAASHALWKTPTEPRQARPEPLAVAFTSPLEWEAPR